MQRENLSSVPFDQGRIYSRDEFYDAVQKNSNVALKEDALAYSLRKAMADGDIIRVSWNQYAVPAQKKIYEHDYSDASKDVANTMLSNFSDARFQIFELIQLNEFVHHLIAHNTIFLYVENDAIDYAFDALKQRYAGRILLKPSLNDYYRYYYDDEIVVCRLPSETPKGFKQPWESRLEKILVDVAVDKLLNQIVPSGEFKNIFADSLSKYYMDASAMFRYAMRKGAEKKLRAFLDEHEICLTGDI